MRALTAEQVKKHSDLLEEAREDYASLEEAVNQFNIKMAEEFEKAVEPKLMEVNSSIVNLKEWYAEMHDDAQNYHDDKSEKWQESERGEAYQAWIDSFDDTYLDEIDLNPPDEIELDDPDFDSVEELKVSPDEM